MRWRCCATKRFGGAVSPERAALLALFHDATEIITGDMPTPVKYYNGALRRAYAEVEEVARGRLLALLPADLQPVYEPALLSEGPGRLPEDQALIPGQGRRQASALIKCVEERRIRQHEFVQAEAALQESLRQMALPEVSCFSRNSCPLQSHARRAGISPPRTAAIFSRSLNVL